LTFAPHWPASLPTTIFEGGVKVGSSASETVTLKDPLSVFPAASVAVQLTVVVPTLKADPEGGAQEIVVPGQLSVAVGVKLTAAEHWPVSLSTAISEGAVRTGPSLSLTVTLNAPVSVLAEASVAVQFTIVVPTGNAEPEGGTQDTVAPTQLSVAVAVKLTVAVHCPAALATVISDGTVSTGSSASLTVTLKPVPAVFPDASVAVQETGVVPTAKKLPEGGLQTTVAPGQLSLGTGFV
jgi:hypothetical protein